jgi:glycerol-3-phosphate acyltransferase PlsY
MIMPDSKAAATTISAISAIVGHNWSLGATLLTGTLRGGKGAATAFGTLLMIAPLHLVVATAVIGTLIVARTRYVSLAVLTTFTLSILWLIVLVAQGLLAPIVLPYAVVLAALLVVRFRGNIQRLLDGTERRLGERA